MLTYTGNMEHMKNANDSETDITFLSDAVVDSFR